MIVIARELRDRADIVLRELDRIKDITVDLHRVINVCIEEIEHQRGKLDEIYTNLLLEEK